MFEPEDDAIDTTRERRSVFFDMVEGSEDSDRAPMDPDPTGTSRPPGLLEYMTGRNERTVLVTNPETDGISLTILRLAPGTLYPVHSHNVDYIEFILDGEVHHGNRVLRAGQGVYRTANTPYSFWAGPEGATIADFRAHTFYTTRWAAPPEEWPPHKLPLRDDAEQ
jgi:hypothetical protein